MEKKTVKLLSYNIHKGFSTNNRRFVLKHIREAIRDLHPDLILLQEVQGEQSRLSHKIQDWPEVPQVEYLAHELWPHFTYGKNAVYTHGHHGNAILSKFPIRFWENIDVSTNRLEKRGLLHAELEVPGRHKPFHAICVHLGLFEMGRRKQILRLCERIESHVGHDMPFVIGGDFNDWRRQASKTIELKLGAREAFHSTNGTHARSFPSWLPALHLDRIYYRGAEVKLAKCLTDTPWNELSDHAALYVELVI